MPDSIVLGGIIFHSDGSSAVHFEGGETAALARLQHYLWDADCLGSFFETRNGMVGADYSSKFGE